jgi:hypothetical protein
MFLLDALLGAPLRYAPAYASAGWFLCFFFPELIPKMLFSASSIALDGSCATVSKP